jgi:hypothetical protein
MVIRSRRPSRGLSNRRRAGADTVTAGAAAHGARDSPRAPAPENPPYAGENGFRKNRISEISST